LLIFLLVSRPVIERPADVPDAPMATVVSADAQGASRSAAAAGGPSERVADPPAPAALLADASFAEAAVPGAGNAGSEPVAESGGLGWTLFGAFLWGGGWGLGHEPSGVIAAASPEARTVADWLRQRHQVFQGGVDALDRLAPHQRRSGQPQRDSEPAAVPRAWPLRVDQPNATGWPHGAGGWISRFGWTQEPTTGEGI
jgi:hypothetical protein